MIGALARSTVLATPPEQALPRQHVLIVTYHFPPDASVGGLRWQKFVEYLPQFGWTPQVLTAQPRYYEAHDPARLGDAGDAALFRTPVLPNLRTLMRARMPKVRLSRLGCRERLQSAQDQTADSTPGFMARWFYSFLWLPDDHLGWFLPALTRGLRVCRATPVAAIVSSGPPHTGHLVGAALHRIAQIPWIADFRNPWATGQTKPWFVRSALSDALDRGMEKAVVKHADAVVVTTERLRARLCDAYPDQAHKVVTITNGFDPDDFPRTHSGASRFDGRFTITHAGSLYGRRSAIPLLEAVAHLIAGGAIPASRLRLVFAGDVGRQHEFDSLVDRLGLSTIVDCRGWLPYRDTVSLLHASDLLLLFAQSQPEQVPAKLFDYIAARRRIIAVAERDAAADVVLSVGGTVVSNDAALIAAAIRDEYRRWQSPASHGGSNILPHPDALRRYDRVLLTGRLAALLGAETTT